MELEWDEEKRQDALSRRDLDFADVVNFDFATAHTVEDRRRDYGEPRFIATGYLHGRLCVLCWTPRGNRMRVISLRKANDREQEAYADYS
jgi:uncharacterized DUF497 family protein